MFLKNVSKEIVAIRWNGINYNIEPGKVIDIRATLSAKTDQEETCIAERFETKTGRKLLRESVIPAPKEAVSTPKSEEKAAPAPIKEEKSDGKGKNTKKGGKR